MSCQSFSPDTTVAEALGAAGAVSRIFIRHRTACVGCYLARFCTLKDVTKTYGIDMADFLEELQQAAQEAPTHITGGLHAEQG